MSSEPKKRVDEMTNLKNFAALCLAAVLTGIAGYAFAQNDEDLDSLLNALESDQPAAAAKAKDATAEAKDATAEAKDAPAEAEDAPAEAKDAPAEAEDAPAEAEDAKPEAEDAPAEAKDAPAEAEDAPAEAEDAKPDEKAEAEATEIAEAEDAPAEAEDAKPEEKAEEPEEKAEEPEEKAEEPEEKAEEPEEKSEEPEAGVVETKAGDEKPVENQGKDAELLANIRETEKLRRESLDAQAKREIVEARQCMIDREYEEATRHYALAIKLLNDRPSTKNFRRECDQGLAEGYYRAALQENELGRRDRAIKHIEKAIDLRHPKARRVLERWNAEDAGKDTGASDEDFRHRYNDADYKKSREQIRRRLKRSSQFLSVKDMKRALEECEVVLKEDPYNREAIRIREAIQKKRQVILNQEKMATHDGLIADVDEKMRTVYAVDAKDLKDTTAETVKKQTGEDPERTQEQDIEARMKAMRLPTISFKPPATIIEAVDFFRSASKDFDRPDIPVEKRGFNFVLKTPVGAIKAAPAGGDDEEDSEDFAANDETTDAASSGNGLPPIPTITASDISFYEALKLVCDSVDYKFIVRGPVVMVMQKDMSTAELLSRKYDVLDAFLDRMNEASDDVKQMRSQGFGGNGGGKRSDEDGENKEKDWKGFFEQLGVKWPEGSSIMYIKTLGKLYVRNTRENLAEFEKVLQEMGSQPKLIEIETRFVEVMQEDLNSLGFEWIMNSDYTLTAGNALSKVLGIRGSVWGEVSGSETWSKSRGTTDSTTINGDYTIGSNGKKIPGPDAGTAYTGGSTDSRNYQNSVSRTEYPYSKNGRLIRKVGGTHGIGVNAFGGTDATYGNGNRYISQSGNYISGGDKFTNDQFMRFNAFLGAADLSMILHMLSQRSDTDLLSAPKIVTKSGENAVIKVVVEYIYPQDYDVQLQSNSSSGGGSYGGSSSSSSSPLAIVEPQNFTMREVGVILDVTPTYSEANGGTIDLELKPQVIDEPIWHNYGMKIPFTGGQSSQSLAAVPDFGGIINSMVDAVERLGEGLLPDETKADIAGRVVDTSMNAINNLSMSQDQEPTWYDVPMEQPFFPVRSIDSKVSITPGATVVMGGLITETRKAMDDKVPFLGDLPFIGRLFRSHAEQTVKKNLLIFVTGRLITPAGRELAVNADSPESSAEVKPAPTAE